MHQSIKLTPEECIRHFASQLTEMESKLSGTGKIIPDDKRLRAPLKGLPDEYSTTKEIIRGFEKSHQQALAILVQKEVERRLDDGKE
ncbi:hypothetical protein BWQ96_03585 [Gracilariopsis chorda]|uniref:Uncharacterized protein n=1 Tax=Gracilariopsis chorda TaxID=448386 RepID=A0A2V3IWR9_9FLOR|nr:hypothetical protein BWQ96_03585 [Gracilariopsis chorda]|eukprot:PXF46596.1 hypothetical protein BWQ96_03585 [Gracilariopsis chorda]